MWQRDSQLGVIHGAIEASDVYFLSKPTRTMLSGLPERFR